VHAFAYAPANPHVAAPRDERPPYVVFVHGGPTAHVTGAASAAIAYYTSRGVGVLDVNYGGSTGYGRAYRERLRGMWGVVDVEDVLAAARGLVAEGLADPGRLAIRGSSAGGWTVLSALVRGGVFTAGISRYGVTDLRSLVEHSPDFEAHYIEGLVGPLPASEALYAERSPLTHAGRIDVPVLLLQGADDPVVPPSQSEAIRDALRAHGIDHEYVLYPGEGHGFRSAETIIDALERELAFLRRTFGL
jgi:dipeptidyl aminopeptidase/acylaminoacyl peptidase